MHYTNCSILFAVPIGTPWQRAPIEQSSKVWNLWRGIMSSVGNQLGGN